MGIKALADPKSSKVLLGGSSTKSAGPVFLNAAILATIVLACSLSGILLRPLGFLSAFWIANAVMLGMIVLRPSLAPPFCWIAATAAFITADIITGSPLPKSILLTAGNLVGIFVGYQLLRRLDKEDLHLERSYSTVMLMLIASAASAASGLVGAVINPYLFNGSPTEGFLLWFISEFTNYIAILPVLFTASRLPPLAVLSSRFKEYIRRISADCTSIIKDSIIKDSAPIIAFGLGIVAQFGFVSSSTLVFPLPGLLWCAIAYGPAATAILTFCFALWTLVIISMGWANIGIELVTQHDLMGFRLGVTLVALGPLTVASVMAARNTMLHEAAAARSAAQEAMSSRTLLLATMAHELRSPLSAIIGLAGFLARERAGPLGNAKYVDFAKSITEAGQHLSALVTDLLDTAKVEAGKIELYLQPTASEAIIVQTHHLVRGLAMDARVNLNITPTQWPVVMADSRAIKQVLINLISNAIKFSPRESTVTLSGEVIDQRLIIRVRDQGPGIQPADLALLGHAYTQLGHPVAGKSGTGLGLTLSMQLIADHGGALRLESQPGTGTTAFFDLPLSDDQSLCETPYQEKFT